MTLNMIVEIVTFSFKEMQKATNCSIYVHVHDLEEETQKKNYLSIDN